MTSRRLMRAFSKVTEEDGYNQKGIEHSIENSNVNNLYRKYVFNPTVHPKDPKFQLGEFAQELLTWALENEVDHYAFISFPHNNVICEKQDSLLDFKYIFNEHLKSIPRLLLNPDVLLKGEADGSSVPSGGMRQTHRARAYTLWDHQSQIFIRKRNNVLYIPSLLVTHHGEALDDKTVFRRAEAALRRNALELLEQCGVKAKDIFLALGLEQEFFVVPTKAYLKRNDLRYAGRTMLGQVGAKHQQFSDHYYAKIPYEIEEILREVENEMLEIGIPLKTKHNEVANNQFEFACIYEDAGRSIDRNLFIMELLRETFKRHGYTVLLHEKPFRELNGSGKHANYSINYVTEDKKLKNLFSVPKGGDAVDLQLFKLFILLTLSSLKRNNALYFASIAVPGNEIRLGGHEAPPKIISAYLGATIDAIIQGREAPTRKDLQQVIPNLLQSILQEDTDRNRTSPYAYTGHKFEFRALGASQNPAFPMSVIAATMAKECKLATERLKSGVKLDDLLIELREQTREVRFEDDGYSHEWAVEAVKRGLYVPERFTDVYDKLQEALEVFVEVGACSKKEIAAKTEVTREGYIKTVDMEYRAFLSLARQQIIPRAFKYVQLLKFSSTKIEINKFAEGFFTLFDHCIKTIEQLEKYTDAEGDALKAAVARRAKIGECEDILNQIVRFLEKDENFPDLEDFLHL